MAGAGAKGGSEGTTGGIKISDGTTVAGVSDGDDGKIVGVEGTEGIHLQVAFTSKGRFSVHICCGTLPCSASIAKSPHGRGI
jgi:hypothetical protein